MPPKRPRASSTSPPPTSPSTTPLPIPPPSPYKTYTYTPTEKNIFTPSPYKSLLLPHWRFATPALARTSSQTIYEFFERFVDAEDFVGADNARKFLQMGMTRAGRYGNWKGGRKYDVVNGEKVLRKRKGLGVAGKVRGGGGRVGGEDLKEEEGQEEGKGGNGEWCDRLEQEEDWEGRKEKKEASAIFRAKWEKAKGDGGYVRLKEDFLKRQKEWKKENDKAQSGEELESHE